MDFLLSLLGCFVIGRGDLEKMKGCRKDYEIVGDSNRVPYSL